MRIGVCSECGTPFEYDDAIEHFEVCEECNIFDADLIGIIDFEDNND